MLKAFAWFAAGLILGGLCMYKFSRVEIDTYRIHWDSGVNRPTWTMLEDIHETLRIGKPELAARKLESLEKHWEEYCESFRERREFGKTPECFVDEITALSD